MKQVKTVASGQWSGVSKKWAAPLTVHCSLLTVVIAACCLLASAARAADKKLPVELYVMSSCPYGVQAENGLFPALKALGDTVDLTLGFIGDETTGAAGKND